jgi:hypothetical protein
MQNIYMYAKHPDSDLHMKPAFGTLSPLATCSYDSFQAALSDGSMWRRRGRANQPSEAENLTMVWLAGHLLDYANAHNQPAPSPAYLYDQMWNAANGVAPLSDDIAKPMLLNKDKQVRELALRWKFKAEAK